MLADVEHGGDVGVVQDPRGARLLLEAAETVRVGGERRRQHLDRDVASEARILCPIHLAHPSGADRREDLVRAEMTSGRETHGFGALPFNSSVQLSTTTALGGGVPEPSTTVPTRNRCPSALTSYS